MAAKRNTRAWARAVNEQFPDLDGMYHLSSIDGLPMVTLFSHAEGYSSFPARPAFHAALTDPAADILIKQATHDLGYVSV